MPVGPLFCVINGPRAADHGRALPPERICAGPPRRLVSVGASRHINSGTPTPPRAPEGVPLIVRLDALA